MAEENAALAVTAGFASKLWSPSPLGAAVPGERTENVAGEHGREGIAAPSPLGLASRGPSGWLLLPPPAPSGGIGLGP